eukprot:evm.model.scf_3925.2 EVM.evm.TU.scf_3925.2   scf_3925:5075-10083(+)
MPGASGALHHHPMAAARCALHWPLPRLPISLAHIARRPFAAPPGHWTPPSARWVARGCCSDSRRPQIASGAVEGAARSSVALADVLKRVRGALGIGRGDSWPTETVLIGEGQHLGTSVTWQMRIRSNGAFVEEVVGDQFSIKWGSTGPDDSSAWEVDSSQVTKVLELDDSESCLLVAWVRTNLWLSPAVAQVLSMALVPGTPTQEAQDGNGVDTSRSFKMDSTSMPSEQGKDIVRLEMRLKKGKVLATVNICQITWLPLSLEMQLCGDIEEWKFSKWRSDEGSLAFPFETEHVAAKGGRQQYTTTALSLPATTSDLADFAPPPSPLMPIDTQYDSSIPAAVKVVGE